MRVQGTKGRCVRSPRLRLGCAGRQAEYDYTTPTTAFARLRLARRCRTTSLGGFAASVGTIFYIQPPRVAYTVQSEPGLSRYALCRYVAQPGQ